ncbi:class I SAM-dependent methyltransferase [Candidatus Parcubacteria bacterium]|jgi:methionine biosynthesis protein MetW|nr:class I SAM-dependent methyltransferase [Candidatus Parcubacteria bacterium]
MQKTPLYMPENHMEKLYSADNFFVRYVHLNRLDNIVKTMPSQDGMKVLDAGCGEGHLLEKLYNRNKSNRYYGIDLTQEALDMATRRCPDTHFIKADLSKLDFEDNFFDFITCTETLEHVDEYQAVLAEFKRVLKPGGLLVVTFPNEVLWTISRFLLGRRPIRVVDHINFFTPRRMSREVDLQVLKKRGLPFSFPFFMSLGCLVKFKK